MPRMKKQCRRSSEYLPHDIVIQVLGRVPTKSLMRFKSVCKQWQSTIRDDLGFAVAHRIYSQTRGSGNHLACFWYDNQKIFASFKDIHGGPGGKSNVAKSRIELKLEHTSFSICGPEPLHGLLCLNYYRESSYQDLVLNLSTHQIVHLPKSCYSRDDLSTYFRSCSFLGYDPSTAEYKLLNVYRSYDHRSVSCEIYTLGTPARRKIDLNPIVSRAIIRSSNSLSPCVNGTIYWLSVETISNNNHINFLLYAFDVGKEEFRSARRFSAPLHSGELFAENKSDFLAAHRRSRPTHSRELFAIGEKLVVIIFRYDPLVKGKSIEVEFIEGYDGGGENDQVLVKERIAFPPFLHKADGLHKISGISHTGEIIMIDDRRSRIVYLDLEKKTWREKQFKWPHPMKDERRWSRVRYSYVENVRRLPEDKNCTANQHASFLRSSN